MMTNDDVLMLLVYANELDGRHSPNEVKVLAWREVFDKEAPDMDVQFAKEQITHHYARTDVMASPVVLVTAWKEHLRTLHDARLSRQRGVEGHCGRGGCLCTHDGKCYKGWIDHDRGTEPCPMCRPELTDALHAIPEPGKRNEHDLATLRNRVWGNNE